MLTTKIRHEKNYVTRPHLHITETCQVFACDGSMTLNKLKIKEIFFGKLSR